VVSFMSRPLYLQGKSRWYQLNRLDGPQSRSGRGDEEKNSQPPPGIEPYNPDRSTRSPALYMSRPAHPQVLKLLILLVTVHPFRIRLFIRPIYGTHLIQANTIF
jgi:hypothetical protein